MNKTEKIESLNMLINREIAQLNVKGNYHFKNPVHRILHGAKIFDLIQLRDSLK